MQRHIYYTNGIWFDEENKIVVGPRKITYLAGDNPTLYDLISFEAGKDLVIFEITPSYATPNRTFKIKIEGALNGKRFQSKSEKLNLIDAKLTVWDYINRIESSHPASVHRNDPRFIP